MENKKKMINIIICTLKSWNISNGEKLKEKYYDKYNICIVSKKDELKDAVKDLKPKYIFFPHWSYIIPKEIYENYNCIVFHMTDLPYGRGGSPLQNLIVRGFEKTKISAIRVIEQIDAGPIYIKEDLSLIGSAEDIFNRASDIIFNKMIPFIIENDIVPTEQKGNVVTFKRRKPEQSELNANMSQRELYDYIRMLDAEGYPKAFIVWGKYKLQFSKAEIADGKIIASVSIEEKKDSE